jgi:hypothetical protein
MKEKGERERENRRGGLVEKERKAGGLGQKAIFFPWLAPWTEVGVGGGLGRRRPAGLPVTAADGERGKEGGRRGGSSPPSPWARARCGVGSTWGDGGGDGLAVVARCDRAARQWRGGGGSVVRRGRRGAIYSRNEAV